MSKRKPYNGDAGYVASRKTAFGHVVIYDRENGGEWIDGSTRWVLAAYDASGANIGLLDQLSLRSARDDAKAAAEGWHDWIACFQDDYEGDPPVTWRPM